MRKSKLLLAALAAVTVLAFAGCKEKEPTIDDKEVFEDDLQPLDEEELETMDEDVTADEDMQIASEEDMDEMEIPDGEPELIDGEEEVETEEQESGVKEDGTYTSKEDVAAYIYDYGHLPSNYITEKEAKELGWDGEGDLYEVAPDKSIGGDAYENSDKMLPEEEGHTYYQCDVDYEGGTRNEKRLIYRDDGKRIFYAEDGSDAVEELY